MKRAGWIGVLVLAILVVLGLTSFAGAERSDSVWVEADSFYVKNSGVNGYSFTIHVPTSMSSADVHSVTATRGEGTAQTDVTVTKNSKFAYTIPESELTAGQEYRIQIDLRDGPTGYWLTPAFTVVQGMEGNGISLSLTNPDGTIPTRWQTGVQYTLHATVTNDAITGLKVWNGLKWVSLEEGTDQTNVVFEHSGEYTLPAVGIIADGEIWASPLTINATSGDSFSESLKVTVDKYYYEREDNIILTITKPSTATLLTIRFATQELNPKTIYTTTIAAESGTTQTVSIPAEAVGGTSSRAEVRCVAPGYEAKSAQSDFISVARKDPPSIWVNAPELYIKKANPSETDGYTFSVVLPEEVRDVPVTGWSLHVYDNDTGNTYYRAWKQEGDEYTGEFTIPQNALTNCWRFTNLDVFVELEGYKTAEGNTSFSVAEAPEDNSGITITMTDENGEIPENPVINKEYTFTIAGSGEINALKIWEGDRWDFCYDQVCSIRMPISDSTCGFAVYGSSDGGSTWEAGYTAKVFTLATAGQLAKPVIILNKDDATYTRGEEISITFDRIKHATDYGISAYSDYADGCQDIYSKEMTTDGSGEGTLTFTIPTEHLSGGIYHVHVWVEAAEYKNNMSNDTQFTVTEGTTPPTAALKVYPEQPTASDEMMAYAYIPNCEQGMELRVIAEDENTAWRKTAYLNNNAYPCYYWKEITGLDAGTYTFAVYGNGESEAVLSRTVTIVPEDTPEPQECGNGMTWTLTEGVLEIRKTGDGYGTMTSHPWTERATQITSVVIGEGVASICEDAFAGCSNMTSLSIPSTITGFPWAFDGCVSLESVYYGGFQEDWGSMIMDYYGRDGYSAFQRATFREFADISTAGIEGYRFALALTDAESGVALETNSDGRYLFENFQSVAFGFDGTDIPGYTKSYRFNRTTRLTPDTDGKASHKETIFVYADTTRTYLATAVYIPQNNETAPILVARSTIVFQPDSLRTITDFASMPTSYALGTEGGLNITVEIPQNIEADDIVDWYLYMDSVQGFIRVHEMSDGLIALTKGTNKIVIPDGDLVEKTTYRVIFGIQLKGYLEGRMDTSLTVLNAGEDPNKLLDIPAVQLNGNVFYQGEEIGLTIGKVENATAYTIRVTGATDNELYYTTQVLANDFGEKDSIEVGIPTDSEWPTMAGYYAEVECSAEEYTSNRGNTYFSLMSARIPEIVINSPESYTKKRNAVLEDGLAVAVSPSFEMKQRGAEAAEWTLSVFDGTGVTAAILTEANSVFYGGNLIIPDALLTAGESYSYTLDIRYAGYTSYSSGVRSFNVLAQTADSFEWEVSTYSTHVGDRMALYIRANGAIPDYTEENPAPWTESGTEVSTIVLEGDITSIGDYVFAGFSKDGLRIEFNQNRMPFISSTAFNGCTNVVCRYYANNDTWTGGNHGAVNATWIYLPAKAGISSYGNLDFDYDQNGWSFLQMNDATSSYDPYPVTVAQASEIAHENSKIIHFHAVPDNAADQAFYAGWERVENIYVDCAGTLNVDLPAENDFYYVRVENSNATVNIRNPEKLIGGLFCSGGKVSYEGNISTLTLAESSPKDDSIAVKGDIDILNFHGPDAKYPYRGTLTLTGTIHNGFVLGNGSSFVIPGVDSEDIDRVPRTSFTNVTKENNGTVIDRGVLQIGTEGQTEVSLEMYRLGYYVWDYDGSRRIGLDLTPKPEYQSQIGNEIIMLENLDITTDDFIYGEDTYVSIQTKANAGTVILNGKTEDDGSVTGVHEIFFHYGSLTLNCPVSSIDIDNEKSYAEGIQLTVNNTVGSIHMHDPSSGWITLGEEGRITYGGTWIRRYQANRSFDEVLGPGPVYAGGSLRVMSRRSGETLQSLLPMDVEIANAAGLAAGTEVSAEISESSEAALSPAESAALNDFLGIREGMAVTVFDASITSDAGDNITSLNRPVEFAVSNEANDEAFILRLHEETDDQGYTIVTATPVSEVTDAAVIPFESDLFSKYVIVRGTGKIDPDKLNTLVLPTGLTRIEANAFEGGAFQAVIIPDGCAVVEAGAFKDCKNLVYVSYKSGTTFEGGPDNVFEGCEKLTESGWIERK